MKRTIPILKIYLALLAIIVVVMSWITMHILQVEHEERLTSYSAEHERLALWRMESMMLPVILSESSRDYSLFMSPQPFDERPIVAASPYVTAHFQSTSTGVIDFMSPVNQTKSQSDNPFLIKQNQAHLFTQLHHLPVKSYPLSKPDLPSLAMLPNAEPDANPFQGINQQNGLNNNLFGNTQQNQSPQVPVNQQEATPQQAASNNENKKRILANSAINNPQVFQQNMLNQFATSKSKNEILVTPMTIFWRGDHLCLARLIQNVERAVAEEDAKKKPTKGKAVQTEFVKMDLAQGCLLDWKQLKSAMLKQISDLLPDADLVPISIEKPHSHHALVTIPVMLVPGKIVLPAQAGWSPMQISLLVAWGWLILSAVAIGVLLFGVVRLSERRATFVSAVTHELRTPLTTFQLYSDLLANREALTDEKQTEYVKVLQVESERLSHLVENVLSWSRMERTADAELIETIDWNSFIERIEPSLKDRVMQAGMSLEIKSSELKLIGNRTAVERILFNLVDNSCKYAKHANNKQIHIEIDSDEKQIIINVRDYGPGIPAEFCSSLFEPFTKSATDAARSAAGVGLGLSLCRRLARQMKGDLIHLDSTPAGVVFQLQLPQAVLTS